MKNTKEEFGVEVSRETLAIGSVLGLLVALLVVCGVVVFFYNGGL
jgi:hypothetical protein